MGSGIRGGKQWGRSRGTAQIGKVAEERLAFIHEPDLLAGAYVAWDVKRVRRIRYVSNG